MRYITLTARIATFFLISLVITTAFLQTDQTDIKSIEARLKSATPTEKAVLYLNLAELYHKSSIDKFLENANKSLTYARQTKNKKIEAEALRMIGLRYYAEKEEYEKALELLKLTLNLYKEQKDKVGIALTLNNIGFVYYNMDKVKESLDYQLKSLKLKEELGDIKTINSSLNNIGLIYWYTGNYKEALNFFSRAANNYMRNGNQKNLSRVWLNIGLVYKDWAEYDLALDYFYKTLEIMEKLNDKKAISVCANNIAAVHQKIGRYEEALTFSKKALKLSRETGYKFAEGNALNSIGGIYQEKKQYKKALTYFKQSLQVAEEIENQKGIANILSNMGYIVEEQGNFQQALNYYNRSLNYHESIGNKKGTADLLIKIGHIYLKLHQYNNSLEYASRSLKLNKELQAKGNLEKCYGLYSMIYEAMGNMKKALQYYKLHAKIKNEIFTKESDEKISRLQTKYKTLQKDKEIEGLKISNKLQEMVIDRQKIIRNVAIIIAFLLVIIFFQFYRQYRYLFTFWKKKNYIAHYKLEEKIGSGGMGDIYKARDIRAKSRTPSCAIKILKEEYYKDEKYKTRFKNEAALIDQLFHPNIVKVMERGEHNGTLYIAMELLEGETLADLLEKEIQFSMEIALIMMTQMAEALAAIHKRGIIHRDLKPENIMVNWQKDHSPSIKILDFGLAKAQNLTRLTRTGMIMGTIYYLAPEQLTRSAILPAGDIYSLGVIYYQILTGEKPFSGDSAFAIARQILKKEPDKIETHLPNIPAILRQLIKEMMAKSPDNRPSALEVLDRLKVIVEPI